jgi:hypothetical protein
MTRRKVIAMLFFIAILAALALWAVIAAVVAMTRDGRGHPDSDATRPVQERRDDYPLLTNAFFSAR